MDKNKLILPLSILLASLILGGFFYFSQVDKQESDEKQQEFQNTKEDLEKQNFLFNKKTECMNICRKLYQEDVRTLELEYSVFNPSYSYNEKENACFYSGGWLDSKSMTARIINCQTNEEVLTFTVIDDEVFTNFCDTCVESREEFNIKEIEIMGSNGI